MNKTLLSILLSLVFNLVQAAEISVDALKSQQDAQALCEKQRLTYCTNKLCQDQADKHCVQTCEDTVKNECRQAGE